MWHYKIIIVSRNYSGIIYFAVLNLYLKYAGLPATI